MRVIFYAQIVLFSILISTAISTEEVLSDKVENTESIIKEEAIKVVNQIEDSLANINLKTEEEVVKDEKPNESSEENKHDSSTLINENDSFGNWGKNYIILTLVVPLILCLFVYYKLGKVVEDVKNIKESLNKAN